MRNALIGFRANMALTTLYDYLVKTICNSANFDDLLRSKIVYAVSAFDKLMHDIICKGMVEIYVGKRPTTPKYLAEPIRLELVQQLNDATIPPPEVIFELAMRDKLKILSFQDPDKLADGLAYIWNEKQKWSKIANTIGNDEKNMRTKLKLIVARRNSIVHEADIDPVSETKRLISRGEVEDLGRFLRKVGEAIHALVAVNH